MLNFFVKENKWEPPYFSENDLWKYITDAGISSIYNDYLVIFNIEPYIDSVYVHYDNSRSCASYIKRFTFKEEYIWNISDEEIFIDNCFNNPNCGCNFWALEDIYHIYSKAYPDWKLKRYYKKPIRLLDHIYNCMKKNTAKEMLYKIGLDELAANIDNIDELNLMATKPSEIYDGITLKVLRKLNNSDGAFLLASKFKREFVKELNMKFPDLFKEKLNNIQCRYLNYLISDDITVGEVGRLFRAQYKSLITFWNNEQYKIFLANITNSNKAKEIISKLEKIDPIYKRHLDSTEKFDEQDLLRISNLEHYLLTKREDYDKMIRRSIRKRDESWQERENGYVVRYPQTINDFCRDAVFMHNCMLSYVQAFTNNHTTILFVRREDSVNTPFITMEIFDNELLQAYHRFNMDCTEIEADWIRAYCKRHNIGTDKFHFNAEIDLLF